MTIVPFTPADAPTAWREAQAIRTEVFIDEQQVPPEEELDAYDAGARHWLVRDGDQAIATARAVAKDGGWKIGRVAVRAPWRGRGVGLSLMQAMIEAAREIRVPELVLDSQTHALGFYERLGFRAEGPEFLDANIPHRRMRLRLPPAT